MDLYNKISILGPEARYDTCGPQDFGDTTKIPGVYKARVSGSRTCSLFKVLQTNACQNNCLYCALRKDRNSKRVIASPDDIARSFDEVVRRRLVQGLFLSSGIVNNPTTTMTRLLDTVHIIRDRYRYKGYIHLKIMPKSPNDCILEAVKIANRVSINIEAPTQEDLSYLSPDKDIKTGFFDTLDSIRTEILKRKSENLKAPTITTQFIVGAGKETDKSVIEMTKNLYSNYKLWRIYFSPFKPVSDTPLENKEAETITRAHRLYQTDFLMRFYRFNPTDIYFDEKGKLDQNEDPKTIWAKNHPEAYPININKADYWELLKVPGIGPESAKKIISKRNNSKINSLYNLERMRIQIEKISSYVNY